MVDPLGIVEVGRHFRAERFVAVCDHVEQIANRNNVTDPQRITLIDQQLHHHFQRRSFTLEHARHRDQCLDQCRAERIDLAKHLAIAVAGEQRGHDGFANLDGLFKGRVEFGPRALTLAFENAFFGDGRQVAVFERDHVKLTADPSQ